MDAPTPVLPPIARAKEADTITALISDLLTASISTFPTGLTIVPRLLSSIKAFVLVRITFVASAPAPLTPTAVLPAKAAAIEAAAETALIVSVLSARRVIFPPVTSASLIKLSTLLLIVLWARDTPIETETPVPNPKEAATEAAPAIAEIVDISVAVRVILSAWIPNSRSPSMVAPTSTPIQFSEKTPEPLTATPVLPTPIPTEAAMTAELIV